MPETGTCLAFDYGSCRIGVAIGEARLGVARPLSVVGNVNGTPDWPEIDKLTEEWKPTTFIVGWPLTLSGDEQEITAHVRGFIRRLRGRYDLPVHRQDERFSSSQAEAEMRKMRASGQRRKRSTHEDIDKLAAAVILEAWFSEQAANS